MTSRVSEWYPLTSRSLTAPSLCSITLMSRMRVDAENPSLSHSIHTDSFCQRTQPPASNPHFRPFTVPRPCILIIHTIRQLQMHRDSCAPETLGLLGKSWVRKVMYKITLNYSLLEYFTIIVKRTQRTPTVPLSIQKLFGHISKRCSTVAHQRQLGKTHRSLAVQPIKQSMCRTSLGFYTRHQFSSPNTR